MGSSKHRSRIAPALVALALAGCGEPSSAPSPDAATDASPDANAPAPPAVTISTGALLGTRTREGVRAFLGVPYAATTAGANRFRAPQPAERWTTPRDATRFGSTCAQAPQMAFPVPGPRSEDCLTVNVWTPDPAPATPLPVMVWIYGGGFVLGGTTQAFYEGSQLAARGAVVVTLNYRVGALGFLAHPALSAEGPQRGSGNWGLLDQIAALQWVRREIAAFGGDPARVTIFGESAGAWGVCTLLGSPLADGLFHRAILQSGSCVTEGAFAPGTSLPLATAEARGMSIAARLGCTGADVLACLRRKTVEEVYAAQPPFDAVTWQVPFQAVIDGHVLPRSTTDRLRDPSFTPPPLVVGTNRDEFTIFTTSTTVADEAAYVAAVTTVAGPHARAVLDAYPARDYATPKAALEAVLRDSVFTCPARALARLASTRQPRTYLYQFSQVNAGPRALGLGATHAGELAYVFHNFTFPFTSPDANDEAVSSAMQGYWTRFAAAGDPNGAGAPMWPAYTSAADARLEIATPITVASGLRRAQCDALAAIR